MLKIIQSVFARSELDRRGLKLDEEVGSGTYSTVYRGTWRKSKARDVHRLPLLPLHVALQVFGIGNGK